MTSAAKRSNVCPVDACILIYLWAEMYCMIWGEPSVDHISQKQKNWKWNMLCPVGTVKTAGVQSVHWSLEVVSWNHQAMCSFVCSSSCRSQQFIFSSNTVPAGVFAVLTIMMGFQTTSRVTDRVIGRQTGWVTGWETISVTYWAHLWPVRDSPWYDLWGRLGVKKHLLTDSSP